MQPIAKHPKWNTWSWEYVHLSKFQNLIISNSGEVDSYMKTSYKPMTANNPWTELKFSWQEEASKQNCVARSFMNLALHLKRHNLMNVTMHFLSFLHSNSSILKCGNWIYNGDTREKLKLYKYVDNPEKYSDF